MQHHCRGLRSLASMRQQAGGALGASTRNMKAAKRTEEKPKVHRGSSMARLERDQRALVAVVEAAAQHAALRAQLLFRPVEEVVLLLVRLAVAAAQLVRDAVVRVLAGQAQLDLHLNRQHALVKYRQQRVHEELLAARKH